MVAWLTDRTLGTSLTKKKANKRLLSYHFLVDQKISPEHIKQYARTGRCDVRKTKV